MSHQPQIVLHQNIPRLQVPLGAPLQIFALLLRFQRPGEGASPKSNDHAYYNIALSEFGITGGEAVETGDYDVDDPWAFLADYSSVKNNNFSANVPTGASSGITGTGSNWKRVTFKWQYLVNGTPFNSGWIQIANAWYYFDTDGYMHTGWLDDNGKRYYLESKVGSGQGVMVTGTREINGKSYSFDASGACTG